MDSFPFCGRGRNKVNNDRHTAVVCASSQISKYGVFFTELEHCAINDILIKISLLILNKTTYIKDFFPENQEN